MVGKPNLVKCFGPKLRLWTGTLDFVPGPSFSIFINCFRPSSTARVTSQPTASYAEEAGATLGWNRRILDMNSNHKDYAEKDKDKAEKDKDKAEKDEEKENTEEKTVTEVKNILICKK